MITVLNISLPSALNNVVEKEVVKGHFSSKSDFFRNLLKLWLESKLANDLEESSRELASGKGKILKLLAGLR